MATSRSLENTPSWALSAVCLFMISISLLLEHSLHLLIKVTPPNHIISHTYISLLHRLITILQWLKKKRGKQALIDAIEKLKSELMLLGFMSLILAATQNTISKICVPSKFADIMLPCRQTTPPIYSCPSAQVPLILYIQSYYNIWYWCTYNIIYFFSGKDFIDIGKGYYSIALFHICSCCYANRLYYSHLGFR